MAKLLCDKTILVLEDEAMIAFYLAELLEDLGCQTVVPAHDLATAREAVSKQVPDLAILDLKLGAELSYPIAKILTKAGVPIIFSTGYDDDMIEAEWKAYPKLSKPYEASMLQSTIEQALSRV
jgi:DNA-binding response OmpR family regulator